MDIGRAEIGMEVMMPSKGWMGKIVDLKMSESGANRIYIIMDILEGDNDCFGQVTVPLDLVCPCIIKK